MSSAREAMARVLEQHGDLLRAAKVSPSETTHPRTVELLVWTDELADLRARVEWVDPSDLSKRSEVFGGASSRSDWGCELTLSAQLDGYHFVASATRSRACRDSRSLIRLTLGRYISHAGMMTVVSRMAANGVVAASIPVRAIGDVTIREGASGIRRLLVGGSE